MEQKAEAIKTGEASGEIQDPDEVIAEMDEPDKSSATGDGDDSNDGADTSNAETEELESEPN
jgi:hypothetical protein